MATQPATLPQQEPAPTILQAEVVRGESPQKPDKRRSDARLWAVVHFLLVTSLLVWPFVSALRDGLRASLPIFLGCYGAAFSITRTSQWRWYSLLFAPVALGLVLVVFAIIQKP